MVWKLYIQNLPLDPLKPCWVDFEWDYINENHIIDEHNVYTEEAEEAVQDRASVSFPAHSGYEGLMGKTNVGRLLVVIFVKKKVGLIRVITARDCSNKERKSYRRRK